MFNAQRTPPAAVAAANPQIRRAAAKIRLCARLLDETNVSKCCGEAERVVRALVQGKRLPSAFIVPRNGSRCIEGLRGMQQETHFEYLAHWNAKGRQAGSPNHPLALAISGLVSKAIAKAAGDGRELCGKTAHEWVGGVIRPLMEGVAQGVESAGANGHAARKAQGR